MVPTPSREPPTAAALTSAACVAFLAVVIPAGVLYFSEEEPSEGRGFRISFGSCLHHRHRPWRVFSSMEYFGPDVVILMGDLIYSDWDDINKGLDDVQSLSEAEYESLLVNLYEEAFLEEHLSEIVSAEKPDTFFMWDDHELMDNYDQGPNTPMYKVARRVFENYTNPRSSIHRRTFKGHLFYEIDYPENRLSAFVLDTRSYRSRVSANDKDKTMLGTLQLRKLKYFLLGAPRQHWKFIVSSVMWNDYAASALEDGEEYLDGWAKYRTEREDIFTFIRSNDVENVVLLSADAHWSGVFQFEDSGIFEFSVSPLASPPLKPPDQPNEYVMFQLSERDGVFGGLVLSEDGVRLKFQLLGGLNHTIPSGKNYDVQPEVLFEIDLFLSEHSTMHPLK